MIRPRFFAFALILLVAAIAPAAEADFTIELGKRVGAIKKNSSLEQLQKAYGAKNVKATELPGPEGSTIPGAVLFKGGDREMHVIWNDERIGQEVFDVKLIGKAWVIADKLKLGATIADVETANGGAFKIGGFAWDLGGYATFEGGKLENKVMVRFDPSPESIEKSLDTSLVGEKQIPTGNKKLRAVKPTVSELFVILR
ncbi:hypothetical protein AYO49_03505 [Verrucomicrobiaceae bacterium SCGC AG-212-N21]|nr:hypothetical protein AYO49_03505 [Verrucomicrobiaceae bacterium SCGC AG-212-N21]